MELLSGFVLREDAGDTLVLSYTTKTLRLWCVISDARDAAPTFCYSPQRGRNAGLQLADDSGRKWNLRYRDSGGRLMNGLFGLLFNQLQQLLRRGELGR